jgi:NAD+ synthase (glutamine-hydrolysing)
MDTYLHCDQSLAKILKSDLTYGILCDIGMPVLHNNVRYNCRVYCLDGKIILIRPKMYLADDGNYRERRFFSAYKDDGVLKDHTLSDLLRDATGGQISTPFGVAAIATMETSIASESCEELWTADSPHIALALAGVEIFLNGSGSHHELRKLTSRLNLIKSATGKCGGAYLYSNHQGCDGNRLYFDGCSLVCVNGELIVQASQFSLQDVEVVSATIDLNDIRSYRGASASLQEQSSQSKGIATINLKHFSLRVNVSVPLSNPIEESATGAGSGNSTFDYPTSKPIAARLHTPEEECALGPACWLWDYLRRSGASGFLLPLSGGADSSSVAAIVRVMCGLAIRHARQGNEQVIRDIQRILGTTTAQPGGAITAAVAAHLTSEGNFQLTAEELCASVLHTVYMGTSNSSRATRSRAERLSQAIGGYHNAINIDMIVTAVLAVFSALTTVVSSSNNGKHSNGSTIGNVIIGDDIALQSQPAVEVEVEVRVPRFESQGGSPAEDLALQNIQARIRMVMAYMCAQLFPWLRGKKGFLLVLGSANVSNKLWAFCCW